MKILVTGAAGFIGAAVSQYLINRGDHVVGIDNINDYYDVNLKHARLAHIKASDAASHFTFIEMGVEERDKMTALFEEQKFDRVVHLAAQAGVRYSLENPNAYVDSNIVGFVNILEGCRHNNVGHLVYASSSSVYGANETMPFSEQHNVDHQVSLYAASKKANELMAHTYSHLYNLPTTGLRFFTVYGPWGRPDMALFKFTKKILEGDTTVITAAILLILMISLRGLFALLTMWRRQMKNGMVNSPIQAPVKRLIRYIILALKRQCTCFALLKPWKRRWE